MSETRIDRLADKLALLREEVRMAWTRCDEMACSPVVTPDESDAWKRMAKRLEAALEKSK